MKLLKRIHDEINNDIFGGCLDKPEFLCLHDGSDYGWWVGIDKHFHNGAININPVHCADWLLIFGTMAHEMIHQFQEYENKRLTHGKFFYKMASEIETFYQLPKGSI